MKRTIKLATVAGAMLVAALGYQAGAPGWIYATAAAGSAATLGAWHEIERRAVRWMPDEDFPSWILANLSTGASQRKERS